MATAIDVSIAHLQLLAEGGERHGPAGAVRR
jgi:hypothetical protein